MPKQRPTLNPNLKILIFPVLSVLLLILIAYQTTLFALSYIKKLKETESDNNRKISVLDEKLSILTRIKESSIDYADISLLAIPIDNPALWLFNSLKTIAVTHEFEIDDVRLDLSQSDTGGSINVIKVDLTVSGDKSKLFSFINDLETTFPIIRVNLVDDLGQSGNNVKLSISTFHSTLPLEIPALSQPIKSLSEHEEEVLNDLTEYTKPEFTKVEGDLSNNREDPFK